MRPTTAGAGGKARSSAATTLGAAYLLGQAGKRALSENTGQQPHGEQETENGDGDPARPVDPADPVAVDGPVQARADRQTGALTDQYGDE
jgi:hypothetical protein